MAAIGNHGFPTAPEAPRTDTHTLGLAPPQTGAMPRAHRRSVRRAEVTPLGALLRGFAAGLVGTAAMTAYQELVSWTKRSRAGDSGKTDSSPNDWHQAPAPAQVGKRLIEGLFQYEVSPDRIPLLTHAMHWAYGIGWGGVYGIVQGTAESSPLRHGLVFGTGVWGMSYIELVPMGLYRPPWVYSIQTLATDLSYHLVYGVSVAAAYEVLQGGGDATAEHGG